MGTFRHRTPAKPALGGLLKPLFRQFPNGVLGSCASPSNPSHLTSLCNTAGLNTPSRSTGGVQPVETHPAVRPFRVDVQQEDLDDLRRRIAATRWPSKELVEDRSYSAMR
jgi:hypothetical protein